MEPPRDITAQVMEDHKRTASDSSKKAEKLNNWGLIGVAFMLFPVVHYVGLIIIFFCGSEMINEYKKAEYSRGFIEGFEWRDRSGPITK